MTQYGELTWNDVIGSQSKIPSPVKLPARFRGKKMGLSRNFTFHRNPMTEPAFGPSVCSIGLQPPI